MPHPKKNHKENHTINAGPALEDFVYGAIDGTVTTFAVVAGVAGANLAGGIALILGFANLLSDGFSMAASDFLSKRSKKQFMERERKREEDEVDHMPSRERAEIREIYKKKGFKGKLLDQVVATLISNKKRWIDVMMREELNLVEDGRGAGKSALVTFFSFLIIGIIPLFAYLMAYVNPFFAEHTFFLACILTALTFFSIGAVKGRIVQMHPLRSGFQTLFLGGSAAAIAYGIGMLLSWVVTVI